MICIYHIKILNNYITKYLSQFTYIYYDQQTNNIITYNSNSNCIYHIQISNVSQKIYCNLYTYYEQQTNYNLYITLTHADNHKHAAIYNIDELSNLS